MIEIDKAILPPETKEHEAKLIFFKSDKFKENDHEEMLL